MSTFFLSISGGADVLLVDSGGTYLAYQAGSDEGGGGEVSYTFTPTFDTALIPLPSDVVVWYSTDNLNFSSTGGIAGATRNGNVLSATLTGSGTIYAALVYVNGSRVTDETGAEIASVSAAYGGSVPTTIGTVTLNSPADITVGDPAVSYTATISGDATDETYAWDVSPGTDGVDYTITDGDTANATIDFLTANTYTVTCTVSSVTASDSPAVGTDEIVVGAGGIGGAELWSVTGPGSTTNLSGQDSSDPNCGFTFAETADGVIGFQLDASDRLLIQFNLSGDRTAFVATYPPTTGLAIVSTGAFSDQVVTWTTSTNRLNNCVRYNNPTSVSLADLRADMASGSAFTITFRSPS